MVARLVAPPVIGKGGHWRVENIAATRNGADERLLAVAECASDVDHALRDRPFADDRATPYGVQQFILGNDSAVVLSEVAENVERFRAEAEVRRTFSQLGAVEIERELAE